MRRIQVGISACLVGERVRYDGGHKFDRTIVETLGAVVDLVAVCPEFEAGFGVPREAVHLVGDPGDPAFMTVETGVDHTARIKSWSLARLDELAETGLCGFVLKARSPSCAVRGLTVSNGEGEEVGTAAGIFASALAHRFPGLPLEDEGRLQDQVVREDFLVRTHEYSRQLDL